MNQNELINLMDSIDCDEWLAYVETREHPQEQEAVEACDAFYDYISSFVHE
jgi:hypothetical protein